MEYPNGTENLSRYQAYIHAAHRERSAALHWVAGAAFKVVLALPHAVFTASARALRGLNRTRRRRAAQRELERMDDHLLNDLGINRADIRDVVRNGKPEPQIDASPELRHPHEAKRAADVVDLRRERDLMGALIVHGPWSHYTLPGRKRNDAA